MIQVILDAESPKPLVRQIIAEELADLDGRGGDGKLCYSAAEAGQLLAVNEHVVRDMRLAGKLRGVKVGRSWRYPRRELERFLEDGRNMRGQR